MTKIEIDIFQSKYVPKHEILGEDEKLMLLKKLDVKAKDIPKIKSNDAVVELLGAKKGDIVKITRNSEFSGENIYYRIVVG